MVAPPLRYETGIVLPVCLGRFRGGSLQLEGLAPGPEKSQSSIGRRGGRVWPFCFRWRQTSVWRIVESSEVTVEIFLMFIRCNKLIYSISRPGVFIIVENIEYSWFVTIWVLNTPASGGILANLDLARLHLVKC